MAHILNNLVGFETGGLEEALATNGAPSLEEVVVRTGDYSLKMDAAGEQYDVPAVSGGGSQGSWFIVGFAVRLADKTPASEQVLLATYDGDDAASFELRLQTNGDIWLYDANGAKQGDTVDPFTENIWHYFEIAWEQLNQGDFDLYIDGNSKISVGNKDLAATGLMTEGYYRLSGVGGDQYWDDIYCYSGAAGVGDFLGDAEVYKYQSTKASDTPDNGSVLDAGTWDKAGETPLAATATNPEYENTGAGSVDSNAANGFPEGPKNDARIDGDSNIKGMKGISNMKRSGGGGTAHYILMGNDVDGTTRSPDIDPTTAFVSYFFISELGSIVPTTAQYCSIGFEMTNAQDYECQEQWAMLLHVPSVGPPVGADEMMAAIGQQTGGGGGSGDIMAHSRKPPEAVAY